MMRLRHSDEWVGVIVVLAVLAFIGITLQAGVLRDWFRPVSNLRLVLPDAGVGGLSEGAEVQVLGIHAGTIRRIVISPDQQMYAVAEIDDQARAFIRRDSAAVIRKSFGVAGAAFVDISRGSGATLDWSYAVLQATTERAPTESVGALIDQVREKVFPILDDAGRAAHALADTMEHIEKGEGNIGRLLKDDSIAKNAEDAAAQARATMAEIATLTRDATANIKTILTEVEATSRDTAALVRAANSNSDGVPALLKQTNATLAALQGATTELSRAAKYAPQIARNVAGGTDNLGGLLLQTQETARELELLLVQLRGLWILGGSSNAPPPAPVPARLPAAEVRP